MGIGMVLFWALIIVGIIALVRVVRQPWASPPASVPPEPSVSSPEQVLAARFARGEIDEAEYQQRLAVLRSHAPP